MLPRQGQSFDIRGGSLYIAQPRATYFRRPMPLVGGGAYRYAGQALGANETIYAGSFPTVVKQYLDTDEPIYHNSDLEDLFIPVDRKGFVDMTRPLSAREIVLALVPSQKHSETLADINNPATGYKANNNIGFSLDTTPQSSFVPYYGPFVQHATTGEPNLTQAIGQLVMQNEPSRARPTEAVLALGGTVKDETTATTKPKRKYTRRAKAETTDVPKKKRAPKKKSAK